MQHTGAGWRSHHDLQYHAYLILPSNDLKDAVAFAYNTSFSVRKSAATGEEEQNPHQDVCDTEEAERSEDADEEKRGGFDAENKAFAKVPGWKISASTVPEDYFVACVFS